MEILKAKINWKLDICANPQIVLLIDKFTDTDNLIYKRYPLDTGTLYIATDNEYVDFFFADPRDKNGYGGREFNVKVLDCKPIDTLAARVAGKDPCSYLTIKGPWSSSAAHVNAVTDIQCVEVSLTDEPDAFDRGWTLCSGAITVEKAEEALAMIHPKLAFYHSVNEYIIDVMQREELCLS